MTSPDERSRQPAPRPVDVVLAVLVAGVLAAIIAVSAAGADKAVGVSLFAYVFAVGFGAALLLRRLLPVPVLILSALGTFAYYTLGFPAIGVALPVVAALYSAAEAGRLRWAIGTGAVVFGVSLYFRLRDDPQPLGYLVGTDAVTNVALIAAAIALGYGLRTRRIRDAQQREITRLVADQATRDTALRVETERRRISHELHDTVGHALSAIALHASVGREAIGRDNEKASAALDQVRRQSTTALQELRSMVRLLRTDTDERTGDSRAVHSLADLDVIVEQARAAGVDVSADVTLEVHDLPRSVDAAAYRVIQESVTNVMRHAHATAAQVRVRIVDGQVGITITDNGQGGTPGEHGYGITGMTERVRLLGGSLRTHSAPGQGFTVEATLPARLGS